MKYKMRAFSAKDGIEIVEDFYWFEERGVREININEFGKRIGFGHYEDYIFELSTGLLDKNGTEIYEGDIVKFNWHNINNEYIGNDYVIKFGKASQFELEYSVELLGFYGECKDAKDVEDVIRSITDIPTNCTDMCIWDVEVIGTIHDKE